MPTPPPLPEVVLARVLRIARFDGLGVLALAGAFALVSALDHKVALALIGVAAAGAGAAELHGVAQLGRGEAGGMRWLLASQPILLAAVLAYCAARLWFVPLPPLPDYLRNVIAFSAEQWGMSVETYLAFLNRLTMGVVAVASVALQGGLFTYYWRRRAPIRQALASEA
ncbi:MAG: hypothetical protein JNK23_06760 [Opitutaceae bacterium]|nr:hypothetical protein [Opitutaceae bacterium]